LWIAAAGRPRALHVFIFIAGTFLTRSAGCAINDVADRHFDRQVKRTAGRVLATGAVRPREAIAVAVVLALAAALLLLALNALTFALALVGVLLAIAYPLFKRFFPLPQAALAVAFSFGIPMAFAAVRGHVPAIAWWLFAANLFWVVAYDTEYAMVDRDDDLKIGVRSSAVLFAGADVAAVMLCYGAYLALLLPVGLRIDAHWPFFLGWSIAAGIAVYHYTLIRGRERESCLRAFRHNQWLGAAVFGGIVLDYALR